MPSQDEVLAHTITGDASLVGASPGPLLQTGTTPPVSGYRTIQVDSSFVERARSVISHQILNGGVSVQSIARALGTSGRTLQRRLHEQGTSLQHLIAAVRCEIAVELLAAQSRPASEVAELLGFSAPSAFHRAFKRWTGRTPGDYRRKRRRFAAEA